MLKFGAKIGENERIQANDSKFVHSPPEYHRPEGKKEEYSKLRLAQ